MRQLLLNEGKVYGARYYTVQPGPFWELHSDTWADMMQWNIDAFGPTPDNGVWTPNARWYVNNGKFWFRTEKDRTLFLLKWQ